MWRSGRPSYCGDAGWRSGLCFGGESSSSSSQQTTSEDNRVAADSGGIAAGNNSSVTINSTDPATVLAALQTAEQIAISTAAISGTVALGGINAGVEGIDAGAAVAGQGIDATRQIASTALSANESVLMQVLGLANDAISAVASETTNATALTQSALDAAVPQSAMMRQLLIAGTIVLVVFFVSRANR